MYIHYKKYINVKFKLVLNIFIDIIWQVLSELDIFAVVGANKPLQLINSGVSVKDDGVILIRFESINGSPMVSGICIRKAKEVSGILFWFAVPD